MNSDAIMDRDYYVTAMRMNDCSRCLRIEEKYDLDGYPPELVMVGLNAAIEDKDAMEAVENYISAAGQPDTTESGK